MITPKLSSQELRVLMLICLEQSNEEIAKQLFISKRTVEWHKNQLLLKTGSRNMIGLVKYAIRYDIFRL
jgi:DNA-binding NarL/FixJ family response regulator